MPTALFVNASLKAANEPHFFAIASASAPVGSPPPAGFMQFQKKVWFQTWAALLNTPPDERRTISSSDMFSNSLPLIRLFRLVTYAWWCLP